MVKKTMVSEDKELQIESLKQNRINSEREIELITSSKKHQLERLALFERFLDVRQRMHNSAMNNYSYSNPTYYFQKDPEYVAAQKELAQIEFEMETMKRTDELEKVKAMLAGFDYQIESQKKAIVDLDEKIKELSK